MKCAVYLLLFLLFLNPFSAFAHNTVSDKLKLGESGIVFQCEVTPNGGRISIKLLSDTYSHRDFGFNHAKLDKPRVILVTKPSVLQGDNFMVSEPAELDVLQVAKQGKPYLVYQKNSNLFIHLLRGATRTNPVDIFIGDSYYSFKGFANAELDKLIIDCSKQNTEHKINEQYEDRATNLNGHWTKLYNRYVTLMEGKFGLQRLLLKPTSIKDLVDRLEGGKDKHKVDTWVLIADTRQYVVVKSVYKGYIVAQEPLYRHHDHVHLVKVTTDEVLKVGDKLPTGLYVYTGQVNQVVYDNDFHTALDLHYDPKLQIED